MADLKPRQYKRLGRIAENNPERAKRVAARMEKRASREERGREIAGNTGRGVAKYRAAEKMTGEAFNSRSESLKRDAVKTMTEKGKTKRPDTPLAESPIPSFLRDK